MITNYVNAAQTFEDHLLDVGHSGTLEDIRSADIESFVIDPMKRRSPSTAATRFRCLQRNFKWAGRCEAL